MLAISDADCENIGIWRDDESGLIWGLKDVDQAHEAAYTNHLVRLVASVIAAREDDAMAIKQRVAADAVIEGYARELCDVGAPFVLELGERWLADPIAARLQTFGDFWSEIADLQR